MHGDSQGKFLWNSHNLDWVKHQVETVRELLAPHNETLEGLGFCGPGEAADFVKNQRTAPGGEFALNTNGGGLSYSHPGMYGSFLLVEAVRQLRGEAGERQIRSKQNPLNDPQISLVNGTGGSLSSTGTVILARD